MCKYCENSKNIIENEWGEYIKISNNTKDNNSYLELWGEDYDNMKINYCPMCGRRLNEE